MIDKIPVFLDHTLSFQYKRRQKQKSFSVIHRTLKGNPNMRKDLSTIAGLIALSVLQTGSAALAAQDSLSAAPYVAPGDREKTRAHKLEPVVVQGDARAELRSLQTELLVKPDDAQLHFKLAEAYRKLEQNQQAADEYARAINLDATLWVCYHQLAATSSDTRQIDAAIEKLNKLETDKPKELLLRVALSELYEKRGNYYQAARTLIDCTYAGTVPEKWRVKVNARIHNMLVLSKSQKQTPEETTTQATAGNPEEDMDIMPAPLPVPTSKRSLAQAKVKDAREVRAMGSTPLLP